MWDRRSENKSRRNSPRLMCPVGGGSGRSVDGERRFVRPWRIKGRWCEADEWVEPTNG